MKLGLVTLLLLSAGAIGILAARDDWLSRAQQHIPEELQVNAHQFAALRGASQRMSAVRNGLDERAIALSGTALAGAIRFSRNQAWTAKPGPIPQPIASKLRAYFPAETIRRMRWTVAGRRLSLGTVLSGWYFKEGAVTLNDVVVFSNVDGAQNTALWAHELVHARQYEELGVDEFARLYTTHWAVMESQARINSASIMRRIHLREGFRD